MERRRGYLCLILAALIFSTTEVVLKLYSNAFHPMQITCERFFLGGLILLPFALRHLKQAGLRLGRRDVKIFALCGLCNAVSMGFLQLAIVSADASAVAILYSGNPVFAVILASLLLGEPLRRTHLIALALQLTGILFILNPAQLEIRIFGFAMALLATLTYALFNTLCKRHVARYGSLVLSSFNLLFCGVELTLILLLGHLTPIAALYRTLGLELLSEVPLLSGFTPRAVLGLLYLAIVVSGLGNLFTIQAAKDTSATEASFIYFFKPIFATTFAAVFLHEQISRNRMVGLVFFLLASSCTLFPLLRELRAQKHSRIS